MTDKPSDDEKEAERRFNETLGNLLRTPHKPHNEPQKPKKGREPRPAPKDE